MHNSQALASHESVIRQNALRKLYDESTGSAIVKALSAHYQGASHLWPLLNSATPYSTEVHSATTAACIVITKTESLEVELVPVFYPESMPQTVALTPASVVDTVRAVFSLNISETAEVFGITRQTAYQWMKLTDMEQVRSHENRDRIKQLYEAAQSWQAHPPLKGRWLHALLSNGKTVLNLLEAPRIDLDALQSAYEALAASTANRRREEGERASKAATALADAFVGLGAGRKTRKG